MADRTSRPHRRHPRKIRQNRPERTNRMALRSRDNPRRHRTNQGQQHHLGRLRLRRRTHGIRPQRHLGRSLPNRIRRRTGRTAQRSRARLDTTRTPLEKPDRGRIDRPPCPGRPNARHPRPRKNGHRPDGRRGRSDHTTFRPLATAAASRTIARPDLPAPSGPILPDTLTRVLTSRARRRPTSGQARKWVISTHGRKRTIRASADGRSASRDADPIPTTERAPPCPVRRGRETERRTDAPPFLIFF